MAAEEKTIYASKLLCTSWRRRDGQKRHHAHVDVAERFRRQGLVLVKAGGSLSWEHIHYSTLPNVW